MVQEQIEDIGSGCREVNHVGESSTKLLAQHGDLIHDGIQRDERAIEVREQLLELRRQVIEPADQRQHLLSVLLRQ